MLIYGDWDSSLGVKERAREMMIKDIIHMPKMVEIDHDINYKTIDDTCFIQALVQAKAQWRLEKKIANYTMMEVICTCWVNKLSLMIRYCDVLHFPGAKVVSVVF